MVNRAGDIGRPYGRGNGATGRGRSTSFLELVFINVTGPNMNMTSNIKLHPDEWAKFTKTQKNKVKLIRYRSFSTISPNITNYQARVTSTEPFPPETKNCVTFSNYTVISASSLRSDLSSNASRDLGTETTIQSTNQL